LAVERFSAARRARVQRLIRSRRALAPLIVYLPDLGVLPAHVKVALSAVEELLERYRRYLLVERVLTVESVRMYVTAVQPFVGSFQIDGRPELGRVTAADVSAFVLAEATRRRRTSIRSVATGLRSLLGFLHVEGVLERAARQPRPAERDRPAGFRDRAADGPAWPALRRDRS
jgi:integrase/recombinase XerD